MDRFCEGLITEYKTWPVFAGSPMAAGARRSLPMSDAFASEASQLQDAELDLRIRSNFDRVFSNSMFVDDMSSPKTPGNIKMNSFFEPNDGHNDRKGHKDKNSTPERDSNPRAISGIFKRGSAT